MDLAIETKGLRKEFGLFNKLIAVESLDLKIEKGHIHGFIGPNGAGKSTTIKMLNGAIKSTGGSAQILGYDVGSTDAKSHIGYSPEHPNFYAMSAFDFLVYNAKICGVPIGDAKERADHLLKWMGLEGFRDRNAKNFSAGMKQKLSLAQALIHNPDILVLDEPTANLDPIGRYEVLERIRLLAKKENKTVFVSSHILDELEKVVDHVTIINKGKVIIQSGISDLRKQFSTSKFIIDTSNNEANLKKIAALSGGQKAIMNHERKIEVSVSKPDQFKAKLFAMFKGREGELIEFYPFRMSLENIFLNVIGGENHDK